MKDIIAGIALGKSFHVKTDTTVTEVHPLNGRDFSLDELNGFVGGHIELVTLRDCYIVCNEEGKLEDLPVNIKATHFWRGLLPECGDFLVGDVLICPKGMIL